MTGDVAELDTLVWKQVATGRFGSCTITKIERDGARYQVRDGARLIAELHECGIRVEAPGLLVRGFGPGASTDAVLAAHPASEHRLECHPNAADEGATSFCGFRAAADGFAHDPDVRYVVAGIGYSCFAKWLDPPGTAAAHLRKYDYDQFVIEVDALSGIEKNARQIRDAIMARPEEPGPPRLVLVGYSKGAPDILEAVVRYPEIHGRVAAILSAAGAVGGSALANDAEQAQADLLRHWPGAKCDEGDGGGVKSLRPDVRMAWMSQNPLPPGLGYYSLVTLPTPDRISRVIEKSYRKLGEIDWRNDSQVIYSDQIIPGSTLLGFLNCDHWAIAVPVSRSHPVISRSLVDKNDYPREALLEAVLRFIEEDLNGGQLR
jgi:hypothetical protein